jgi:glycosyltransferase involved in cell wall biosynthesis
MKQHLLISSYDDVNNPTYGGGGAIAVKRIAETFAKNYRVTIVTGAYAGAVDTTINGVRYVRIGTSLFGDKIGQLLYHFALLLYLRSQQFDCLIESFTPPFSTGFTPIVTKKPVIGLVHMLSAADMERKYLLPFHIIENIGLRLYKHFIVLSKDTKEHIAKHNTLADYLVAPNGVDIPNDIASYSKRRGSYILFLGRIEVNQKGLDLLLNAYSKTAFKRDIRLVIAGTGSTRELKKLHELIDTLGIRHRIDLKGRVTGKEKSSLLEGALFGVVSSRYETFSLSALEMLGFGVPLILFNIDGMRWLSEECCVKVRPFNVEDLSVQLSRFSSNAQLRRKLSSRAVREATKYSWDTTLQRYVKYIHSII